MAHRYVAEIAYGLSTHYGFSYIDTEDGLADLLFDHLKVNVEPDMVFSSDGDPYRIIMCKVPRAQRDQFLRAIDLLPAFMAYAGRTDYEDYCRAFFLSAHRWVAEQKENGGQKDSISPLQ